MDNENKSSNRGKGRSRGRGKKKQTTENDNKPLENSSIEERNEPESVTLDMDADITQLEAPTFSTINKGPPEPMLRLNWDHKTHLIGEKVINPMIHCCDKCEAPILIYGRMIPCKHVFCLSCAERESKVCPRCQEKFVRIEKTGLGTVFMCTFGGTRYGSNGCRRTYLSQRDLQAHINHRHVSGASQSKENIGLIQAAASLKPISLPSSRPKTTLASHAVAGDPRVHNNSASDYFHKLNSPSSHTPSPQHQSSRSQSHHHSSLHQEQSSQSVQLNMHQHSNTLQTSQLHLPASSSQQILPPPDFPNPLLVPSFAPPSTHSGPITPSSNMRSNLITVQIHDSNVDSVNVSLGIPMVTSFQNFSPQFTQSSSNIPFPVPPGQLPALGQIPQSHPQFFPNNPTNYATSSQRPSNYNSNSQSQSMMNQSIMSNRAPPMVPPPRRPQFPGEPVIQPFPVPPPHRWHPQSNQSHFY